MTTSDLVSRLLEAIAAKEEKATAAKSLSVLLDWPRRNGKTTIRAFLNDNDPSSVLRRCAADRKQVDLHGIVHRDIGWLEWDEGEHAEMYAELPVCGLCVPKHSSFPRREDVPEGACRTVRILAEGYGLAVRQEGGDRG